MIRQRKDEGGICSLGPFLGKTSGAIESHVELRLELRVGLEDTVLKNMLMVQELQVIALILGLGRSS